MLSLSEYITISLDTNLFFLRIMKEHAFFLEIAFMQKEDRCIDKAKYFRESYESLLSEAADMAPGRVSRKAVKSNSLLHVIPWKLKRFQVVSHASPST